MIELVNALIDSHFSDFYLNKNLQFLLQQINDSVGLLQEEKNLIKEASIYEKYSNTKNSIQHIKSINKDLNPPEFEIESLYF